MASTAAIGHDSLGLGISRSHFFQLELEVFASLLGRFAKAAHFSEAITEVHHKEPHVALSHGVRTQRFSPFIKVTEPKSLGRAQELLFGVVVVLILLRVSRLLCFFCLGIVLP